MADQIKTEDYYERYASWPIIDVRSPGEYAKGHIVGARNIPLFSDAERADVGTIYKKVSREKAIEKGRYYVTPKLQDFVDQSKKVADGEKVIVHCWRGGMRSQAFADHLLSNGISQVLTIEGGYKGYREHMRSTFEQAKNLVVVSGYTGTGKTEVLHELGKLGEQFIDLEGRANHKGSSFGGIGEKDQPTTEHFHNLLFEDMRKLHMERRIWIEDEGAMVGSVNVPVQLYKLMRAAKTLVLDLDREKRANRLVVDYAQQKDELLEAAIKRLTKRMGGQHVNAALEHLERQEYQEVATLCLVYYDKYYQKSLDKRSAESLYKISMASGSAKTNAINIKSWAENNNI